MNQNTYFQGKNPKIYCFRKTNLNKFKAMKSNVLYCPRKSDIQKKLTYTITFPFLTKFVIISDFFCNHMRSVHSQITQPAPTYWVSLFRCKYCRDFFHLINFIFGSIYKGWKLGHQVGQKLCLSKDRNLRPAPGFIPDKEVED